MARTTHRNDRYHRGLVPDAQLTADSPSDGQVLTWHTGPTRSWDTPSAGFSDPMTTRGDIIVRDASNVTARLGRGSANTLLRSNGTDVSYGSVVEADLNLTDVTTANASTSQHGFLKKLPGGTTTFLRADGTFATPGVSGGANVSGAALVQRKHNAAGGTSLTITVTAPTLGNILIGVFVSASGTISSITQTNVSWAKVANTAAGNPSVEIWVGTISASPGTSVSVTGSAGATAGYIGEWSGLAGTLGSVVVFDSPPSGFHETPFIQPADATVVIGGLGAGSGIGNAIHVAGGQILGDTTPTNFAGGAWAYGIPYGQNMVFTGTSVTTHKTLIASFT